MSLLDETHDPLRTSWVADANGHDDFPIQNLPFGLFSPANEGPRPGIAIGDHILELAALTEAGLIGEAPRDLGDILGQRGLRRTLRRQASRLLSDTQVRAVAEPYLHPAADCELHLPLRVGDYTDFYAGIHHARAVGALFRPDNPLLPNYKYVPIGYHGRASSIRPSGVPVRRPRGQTRLAEGEAPVFGPSQRLDYELELGLWIGGGNALGHPIDIANAAQHIAGVCLLNDWSARDLQAWEYQPLGPFLAKNFHTSVSAWVVTAEALEPFRVALPARPDDDPQPLPYLRHADDCSAWSINLEVRLLSTAMRELGLAPHTLSRSRADHALYWSPAQLVTHHASNGCNLTTGDLLGTGTLSGPLPQQAGSLLELSQGGKAVLNLPSGETRRFLEDGDEVSFRGRAEADGFVSIGFGPCLARVNQS